MQFHSFFMIDPQNWKYHSGRYGKVRSDPSQKKPWNYFGLEMSREAMKFTWKLSYQRHLIKNHDFFQNEKKRVFERFFHEVLVRKTCFHFFNDFDFRGRREQKNRFRIDFFAKNRSVLVRKTLFFHLCEKIMKSLQPR